MIHCTKSLPAAVLAAAVASAGIAQADAPAQQDVSAEIKALRTRIDELEAKQQQDAQQREQDARRKQTQASVDSVLRDADHRSSMLDMTGINAGYKDNRFFIASDDGNFVFRPWFHMQFRDVTLWRQDLKGKGDDDVENGFEMRRLRFGFDGNLFTPDLTYFFNWATVRASGTSTVTSSTGAKVGTVSNNLGGVPLLEEAWAKYHLPSSDFYIKGGQIKDPLLHDQVVSSRYQQSTERSLIADIFANGDAFTEAVTVIYDPKSWIRTEAGVTHGLRSANTNFLDYPNTNAFDYGVAGRAEFKAFGRWQDYGQVGAIGVKDPLLVFGVGADYSERGHSGQTVAAADGQYADPSGFSVYGAFVNRYTTHNFGIYTQSATGASIGSPDPAVANRATDEYGIMLQAGYVIEKHWEPFGRYEYMRLQGTAAGSKNYVQAFTAGVNYYFFGNRAKLTAQATYLPNGIPIDDSPNDVLTSPNGRGEISGVVQFQLLL